MNFNDLANQVGRVNDMMQTQFMQTSQGLASVGYENLRNFAQTQDTIKDGNYSLSSQLANCCCTTQRGIDSVNYNGAINTSCPRRCVVWYATPTPSPTTPARARSVVTAAAVRQISKRTLIDKAFSPGQDRGMAQAVPLFQ